MSHVADNYADEIADSLAADFAFGGLRAEPGSPLAKARMAAHAAFDPLWQDDRFGMSRSAAYGWLAKQLGIPKRACHMLYFDEATCRRVEAICMRHRFLNA